MLTTEACAATAVFTACAKSPVLTSLSSSPSCQGTEISSRWQLPHAAETMSMSSEVSTAVCSSSYAPSPLCCAAGCAPPV